MFVLKKSDSYFWPVQIQIPASGGTYEKHSFDAKFKRIPQSRIKELIENSENVGGDVGFCKEVLVGWKGVQNDVGQELEFSVHALEELLEIPMVAKCIATAYLESVSGAKLKN